MAVYVTGMLMPLSMFDVGEWQKLQILFFYFFFVVLDNGLQVANGIAASINTQLEKEQGLDA